MSPNSIAKKNIEKRGHLRPMRGRYRFGHTLKPLFELCKPLNCIRGKSLISTIDIHLP